MARYGGGSEDFEAEARKLDALRRGREELIAKEQAYQQSLGVTDKAEDKKAVKERVKRRAKKESAEVTERTTRVEGVEARNTNLNTSAIERNTQARQRNAAAQRQQQINFSRALRGGADPKFAQAAAMATPGKPPSQYAMRRELGIGQRRAQALQEALGAGLRPASGAQATRPLTRLNAAMLAHERAEAQLTEATRTLTNTRRRKTATDDDRLGAAQARDTARKRRDAARREVAAAGEQEKATRERTAQEQAARREMDRRARSTDIIRHPTLYGQPAYGEAHARRAPEIERVTGQAAARRQGDTSAYDRARARDYEQQVATKRTLTKETNRYAAALTAEQRAQAVALSSHVDAMSRRQPEVLRQTASATQQAAVGYGTLSQQMTRHGALTSEFISAAARGETTLKELGNQSIVTAGKFAGWTLAASAIFGAVRAISRMGEGAIAASSGVNTLKRVINNVDADKAQGDFSRLAEKFNVPIGTAADAVYRMGQVFHNQADATQAAEAALYSFKTGEVDVATSTKSLIAIVNGFGLSARDLPGVFDQINQAQNKFGISIADTEAGLARAGGVYRNAGGDLSYLLGLFVAIQKSTGESGTTIGTGIARGVNTIRKPISKQKLEGQGIDVDEKDFQKTLKRSLAAARTRGADLHQISTGLFGPQYARLIEPVLRDQTRLNKALKETGAEKSKGSAQKELARVLSETREQISALGIGLEQLGASLARSGALAPLGAGLKLINLMLDGVVGLVDVFNQLPHPIRQVVALLAEGALLMKVMRHFGGGERFAGGPLGFLANPDARATTRVKRGLRDASGYARDQAEAAGKREYYATSRAEIAREQHDRLLQQRNAGIRAGTLPAFSPQRRAADQAVAEQDAHARNLAREAVSIKEETLAASRISARADQQLNEYGKLRTVAERRRYEDAHALAIPHEIATPSSKGYRIGRGGAPGLEQEAKYQSAVMSGRLTGAAAARGLEHDMTVAGARAQQFGRRAADAIRNTERTGFRRVFQGLQGGVPTAVERAGTGIGRGISSAERSIAGMRGLGGKFSGAFKTILSGLGPLDAILAAVPVALLVKDQIEKKNQQVEDSIKILGKTPTTRSELRRYKAESASAAGRRDPYQGDVTKNNEFGIELGKHAIDRVANLLGQDTPWQRRQNQIDIARGNEQARRRLEANQRRQRRRGGPVGQLLSTEVKKNINDDVADLKSGLLSSAEFKKEVKERGVEIKTALAKNSQKSQLKSILQEARRRAAAILDPEDFKTRFKGADPEKIRAAQKNTAARLQQAGRHATGFDLREAGAEYRYLLEKESSATSEEQIAKLAEDREAFFKMIADASAKEVEEGLLLARSEGARTNVYSRGRRILGAELTEPRRARNAARKRELELRDKVEAEQQALANPPAGHGRDRPTPRSLRRVLRRDNRELRKLTKDTEAAEKEYKTALEHRRIDLAKLQDQAYQDRQEGRTTRLSLAQARTPDAGRDAALAVKSAQAQVDDARKTYGTKDRRYQTALTALLEARQQQAQALLAGVQADNNLLTARAGRDPAAQAAAAQQAAQNTLNFMRAHRDKFDINDIKNAEADVIRSKDERAKAVVDDAKEIADLRGQLLVARSGDAVGAARASIQAARIELGAARGTKERLQALVDLANANNQLEDAIRERESARYDFLASKTTDPLKKAHLQTLKSRQAIKGTKGTARTQARTQYNLDRQSERELKVTESEDTIDFELDMGKIERDQAIHRYEALLHARGLTKQMRRDILRRIKALKDEGEEGASGFDLDTGGIKLPTPYDVRKAWDPIRAAVKRNHANQLAQASRGGDLGVGGTSGADARTSVSNLNDMRASVQTQVNVYVSDPDSAGEVYRQLDRALGTTVRANLRAKGHR